MRPARRGTTQRRERKTDAPSSSTGLVSWALSGDEDEAVGLDDDEGLSAAPFALRDFFESLASLSASFLASRAASRTVFWAEDELA